MKVRACGLAARLGAALLLAAVPGLGVAGTAPQDAPSVARIQSDVRQGQAEAAQGRPEAAEPRLRRAAGAAEALWGATSPDSAALTYLWAQSVDAQPGRGAEAEALYRLSLERFDAWGGGAHPQAVLAASDLAVNLHAQGRYEDSLAVNARAMDLAEALYGPGSPAGLTAMSNRGVTLRALGRFDEADGLYRAVLAARRATLAPHDPLLAVTLQNLGVNLIQLDRPDEAEAALREALAIREAALGPDHPLTAQTLSTLGGLASGQGRIQTGLAFQERAAAILAVTGDAAERGMVLASLAEARLRAGDMAGAQAAQAEASALLEQALGPDHPETATALIGLGELRLLAGDAAGAQALIARGLAVLERAGGPDNPALAGPVFLMGLALAETGQGEAALAWLERAQALTAGLPESHIARIGAEADLGAALAAARRPDEALPLLRRAGRALIDKAGLRSATDQAARARLDGYRRVFRLSVTAAWDAASGPS